MWYKALLTWGIPKSDDQKLTFAFPAKRLDWLSYAFIWEKYWKGNFSRSVEGWYTIFGTDTLLTKNMEIKKSHISGWP